MDYIRRLIAVCAAGCWIPAFAQQATLAHFEDVLDWRVAARIATDAAEVPAYSASFSAFGRRFDLDLEANARINTLRRQRATDARAYRGTLRGAAGSWARIVISADRPAGILWDGTTLYGIEARSAGTGAIIFRADDITVPPGTMSCGMHEPAANAGAMFTELATMAPEIARAAGATLNLDIGVVADPEFALLYPGDPAAAMLTRINNVDGIYSSQLGVQISVAQSDVFDDAGSDPFSATTDAAELLDELSIFRGTTPAQDAQGLTHLFTGRELDGNTVGIAYVNAVCQQNFPFDMDDRSYGVGLTQANFLASFGPDAAFLESLIAAHEIGHNFGAPHDGVAGECEDESPGYIMSASLNLNADEFSQCSVGVITDNLPSMACLTPVADVDVTISGQSNPASPLTETEFEYVFTVTNLGEQTAVATTAQLEFDPSLQIVSVVPQSGTCGAAQPSVGCELGDLPGTSTRTIDITLQAVTSGAKSIAGTVAATDDADPGNDTFSDSVIVTAASDLALVTSPQSLDLDAPTTLSATLENRSGIAASNVTMTATWSAGIEVAAATFAGDPCTVTSAARSFNCQLASLAGLSASELSVALTGVTSGAQVMTLNVSAQQSDPVAANNSSNIALDVAAAVAPPAPAPQPNEPAAQEGGGGGGSCGPLALLALLGLWRRSRRCRLQPKANIS